MCSVIVVCYTVWPIYCVYNGTQNKVGLDGVFWNRILVLGSGRI